MGGHAFNNVRRIKREEIIPTIKFVVGELNIDGFDYNYAISHMMGSALKQDDSGDIDFAMNIHTDRPFENKSEPIFNKHAVAKRLREILPKNHVNTTTIQSNQFQSCWPICGNKELGYVQIDWVFGKVDWLIFSHWSPGKDYSPWKGVFLNTAIGVLVKMNRDYTELDEFGYEIGRVGLYLDLERGLHRKWKVRVKQNENTREVSADAFETKCKNAPRFARMGYITDPSVVLGILFKGNVTTDEVNTFEKFLNKVYDVYYERWGEFYERFLEAISRGASKHDFTGDDLIELSQNEIWFRGDRNDNIF